MLTFDQIRAIFELEGIKPAQVVPKTDDFTLAAKRRPEESRHAYIDDETFFGMFGVKTIHAVDHSDYEGADIIADLNQDIPPHLHEIADFIFDGSVLDNIFSPSTALKNISRMLKPGGRLVAHNMGSLRHFPAYTGFNPYYFFDYFVMNGYHDVKVYVYDFYDYDPQAVRLEARNYLLDPGADHRQVMSYPGSNGVVGVSVVAEKGEDSTNEQQPSQAPYRSDRDWEIFSRNLEAIRDNPRPMVAFEIAQDTPPAPTGFIYAGSCSSAGLSMRMPAVLPSTYDASAATRAAAAPLRSEAHAMPETPAVTKRNLTQFSGWAIQRELLRRYKARLLRLFGM